MGESLEDKLRSLAANGDDIFEGMLLIVREIDKLKKGKVHTAFNPVPSLEALTKRVEELEERTRPGQFELP